MDAKATKRKGRVTTEIPLTVESIGQKEISGKVHVAANIIDNFGKLSAAEKAQAPVAQLSGTLLDFGKLPEKGSFIPLIGGKVTGTVDITNTGKSPLLIHSISCDNELVDISGGKKKLNRERLLLIRFRFVHEKSRQNWKRLSMWYAMTRMALFAL